MLPAGAVKLRISDVECVEKVIDEAESLVSVVLVAGFLVFLLSALDSLASFGVLLASTIGLALVADFLLMPALVLTWKPWGPGR